MQGPLPSGLLTSGLGGKVTRTIIFGNEHVKACGKEAGSHVLVSQERGTQSWKGPLGSWPGTHPTPTGSSRQWLSGPCGNSPGSSGFSYIWFKHTTTQFSAKS